VFKNQARLIKTFVGCRIIFYAFFTVGDFAPNDTGRDFLTHPCIANDAGTVLPKDGVNFLPRNLREATLE
jgi:hypothetical protein